MYRKPIPQIDGNPFHFGKILNMKTERYSVCTRKRLPQQKKKILNPRKCIPCFCGNGFRKGKKFVFVIDCGKAKETSYDALNNTPCLLPTWISKVSAQQVS